MPITAWNDDEDLALQGLHAKTQVIYLRGLRRYMDYKTGIVGMVRKVSYQGLIETCSFDADAGCREKEKVMTKDGARAAVKELVRAGLVENLSKKGVMRLVLKLPLATRDQSVKNQSPTGTPQEPHPNEQHTSKIPTLTIATSKRDSEHFRTPHEPHRNTTPLNTIHPESVTNCTVLGDLDSKVIHNAGGWVEFFVNEQQFKIHIAQTAKTMPMFRNWCEQKVQVWQVRDAVKAGDAALGYRAESPMYYRNFVKTILQEVSRNNANEKHTGKTHKPFRESGAAILARCAKQTIIDGKAQGEESGEE